MSLDSAPATADEYRDRVEKTSTADDALIGIQLLAATRYFEGRLGEAFGRDATAETFPLLGDGSKSLHLDRNGMPGIATKTGLVIKIDEDDDGDFADETALDNDTLRFFGRGDDLNPDLRAEAEPWRRVELTSRSARSYFPASHLVQVTATRGWPAFPGLLKELVIEWTAVWRGESIRTTARVAELDQVSGVSPYHLSQLKRIELLYGRAVVA